MKGFPKQKNDKESIGPVNNRVPFGLVRIGIIAATVIILWITGNFIFYAKSHGESIYEAYYHPYPNILTPAKHQDEMDYTAVMKLYENGEYSACLKALETVIVEDTDNVGLQFYYAICQLELGNTDFAIADFEYIKHLNDPIFSLPSTWYLSLAYLKLDQIEEAKTEFNTLGSTAGPYQQKTREILGKLK